MLNNFSLTDSQSPLLCKSDFSVYIHDGSCQSMKIMDVTKGVDFQVKCKVNIQCERLAFINFLFDIFDIFKLL